jgi:hypothetical protein
LPPPKASICQSIADENSFRLSSLHSHGFFATPLAMKTPADSQLSSLKAAG